MPKHRECDYVDSRLEAFVDGDVGVRERAEIEAHLERCRTCAAEYGRAVDVQSTLRGLPTFTTSVRMPRVDEVRARRFRRTRIAAAAAAVVLGLAAPLLVGHFGTLGRMHAAEHSVDDAKYAFALVAKYSRRGGLLADSGASATDPDAGLFGPQLKRTGSRLRHYLGEVPVQRIRNPKGV